MCREGMILGIDVGTSAVKVLAVHTERGVVESSESSYGIQKRREGWAEQDPEEWWRATLSALERLSIDLSSVIAIGLSGQLNGLVLVDHKGRPLREAILWLDQRSRDQADRLKGSFGEIIHGYSSSFPGSIHTLSKLLWIRENEPRNFRHAHKLLFAKDYITYKLTGNFVTDVTDAGAALMLDLRRRIWAEELLSQLFEMEKLPELHESPDIVGEMSPQRAQSLSIPAFTPVVAGAGDTSALAVGAGVTMPGTACATIGTAGHIAAFISDFPAHVDERLWVMCHAIPGKYYWHGLVMTGGYSLSWYLATFGGLEREYAGERTRSPYDRLLEAAKEVSVGSDGLIFLPYLSGAATPYNDFWARASFIGITSAHTKAHFTRAVLEGVAFNFRDSFEILNQIPDLSMRQVMVGEGGAKNPLWPALLSDVLGRDLHLLSELNTSALGAAVIAGVGTKTWDDFEDATRATVHTRKKIHYNRIHHEKYNRYYALYRNIYPALHDSLREICTIQREGAQNADAQKKRRPKI